MLMRWPSDLVCRDRSRRAADSGLLFLWGDSAMDYQTSLTCSSLGLRMMWLLEGFGVPPNEALRSCSAGDTGCRSTGVCKMPHCRVPSDTIV